MTTINLIKKILEKRGAKIITIEKKAQIWANPSKQGLKVLFELNGQEYALRREFNIFVLVEGKEYKYSRCTVIAGTFKQVMAYYRFH